MRDLFFDQTIIKRQTQSLVDYNKLASIRRGELNTAIIFDVCFWGFWLGLSLYGYLIG